MHSSLRAFWTPAGAIYLAVCFLGLAAGLWPASIHPPRSSIQPAPLPVLSALAVAQMFYLLLIWPIVLAGRHRRGQGPGMRAYAVEAFGLLATAVPLYMVAAWFSDAVVVDVVRVVMVLAAALPLGILAGELLASRAAAPWTLAGLLGLTLGLAGMYYVVLDFLPMLEGQWAWQLGPLTHAWSAARSRAGSFVPEGGWAMLAWGLAGGVGLGLRRVIRTS